MFKQPTWSVTDLTLHIRDLLESDEILQDLWVEGEVSNLSRPASGHLYFTLKDSNSSLRCVMWKNDVMRQIQIPQNGDAIEVHGSISVYEASGNYQLYADLVRPAGEGALYQQFLRLKEQLEVEGLFDAGWKKPIPPWPQTIGIVTSPTGAALRDMLKTLERRYPLPRVVLAPTTVQGDEAPDGILSALEMLNQRVEPDVILLARGGGSIEDLWAFNNERVARAIVASQSPVITGIGHETDFTIADFAADLRAPTPTAAAELATPNQEDLQLSVNEMSRDTQLSMDAILTALRRGLENLQNRLTLRTPLARVRTDRQRLDELNHRVIFALKHSLEIAHTRLAGINLRLSALNPAAILGRGYSIITAQDGRLVSSVRQVKPKDNLEVRVSDGEFGVRVREPNNAE